jgi:conjugal transfer mating pair stabilization protein TraN
LATSGGNGSSAIAYNVANGTATGCSVSGALLSVPTNVSGTCFVLATQASTGTYLGDSSNVTTVNFFWQYASTNEIVSANYSYSCNAGDTVNGTECNHPYSATPNYTCSVGTLSGTTCTYAATPNYTCSVGTLSGTTCTYAATQSYSCPGGWSQNGSECNRVAGSYSSQANCRAAGTANESNGSWIAYNCTGSGSSWSLTGFINGTLNYSCPSGGSVSGSSCVGLAATISSYSCPSGGSVSGSSCVGLAATISSYSCPSGGSLSGATCTITNDYGATQTISSYNWGNVCTVGGSLGSSATICSISGGSGPNLRSSHQELSTRLREQTLATSTKGTS